MPLPRWSLLLALLAALPGAGAAGQPSPQALDPHTCREIWRPVGLPATAEDADLDVSIVCHRGYVVGHNNRTRTPDWVVARLTPGIVQGSFDRPSTRFQREPNLPADKTAGDENYTGSGFDRGHQAASADFKSSAELMLDTFFLSNAVPQQGPGFNRAIWAGLEGLVQKLARERHEIVVITGPVYQRRTAVTVDRQADACGRAVTIGALAGGRETIGAEQVAVPAALYKIIYDTRLGRANAYLLPNVDHTPLRQKRRVLDYLEGFRVGVNTVEELTGWRFLTALDARSQSVVKEHCAATMLH